ncbi:MAG: SIR2 family protein [Bacteroidales bacterium]|nr:SIR2 family protein [Bacteroidales bacterium]
MVTKKLQTAYLSGAFGIFIGTGISQGSGLPGWEQLLLELIQIAEQNPLQKQKCDELRSLVKDPSKYLMVAEELKEILGSDLYKYIKHRFDDKAVNPSELLKKIIELKSRFIITTNYDTLIEKAYIMKQQSPNDLTYKDASTINYNLLSGDRFLLKAHGDARRTPSEIIITEKDYRTILFKEVGYQSVLHVLFSTCHILFLGVSFNDPELKLLLGFIHNIFHGGSPDHFSYMSKEELTNTEVDRWRKDFNINIIPYDKANNRKELEESIDELLKL